MCYVHGSCHRWLNLICNDNSIIWKISKVKRFRSLQYLYQSVKKYPDRLLGFGWVDPHLGLQKGRDTIRRCVEEYGFLAQELEAIIPGAVAMTEEGDRLVNYSALIPILTGAIQELTARVAALESQLKAAGK